MLIDTLQEKPYMMLSKEHRAILDQFAFDIPPVGVKFTAGRPDKVHRLSEKMALCEMLKKAQEREMRFLRMPKPCLRGRVVCAGAGRVPGAFYQRGIRGQAENL